MGPRRLHSWDSAERSQTRQAATQACADSDDPAGTAATALVGLGREVADERAAIRAYTVLSGPAESPVREPRAGRARLTDPSWRGVLPCRRDPIGPAGTAATVLVGPCGR